MRALRSFHMWRKSIATPRLPWARLEARKWQADHPAPSWSISRVRTWHSSRDWQAVLAAECELSEWQGRAQNLWKLSVDQTSTPAWWQRPADSHPAGRGCTVGSTKSERLRWQVTRSSCSSLPKVPHLPPLGCPRAGSGQHLEVLGRQDGCILRLAPAPRGKNLAGHGSIRWMTASNG